MGERNSMKELNIYTEEVAREDLADSTNVTVNGTEKELGAAAIAGITLVTATTIGFVVGLGAAAASGGKKIRENNRQDIVDGVRQYYKEEKKKEKKKAKKAAKNQQTP
jgi:hypothetical protein